MEIEKAIEILENHNKWRRNTDDSLDLKQANPTELGIAIETVVKKIKFGFNCNENFKIIHDIYINGICKDCGKNLLE